MEVHGRDDFQMEVRGRDDPRRYTSQGRIDFPISVPRHQVFDIDIHGDDGDADPECELNFQARSLESTCPEELSLEGKMEGKNSQPDRPSYETEMTFMLHTDMGTMTASSHVARQASSGDPPMSATTPASTGDTACAHLLERASSQGSYSNCAYSAVARHATDEDSFRGSHCASPATAVGHTLHPAPPLRHTSSNCRTTTSATTNCSSAKDLVALVDSVSRHTSLPVSPCSHAAALFFLLAFVLFCKCPRVQLRLVVCVALCDICYTNASLNVLLYLAGIVFEAGSSRQPPEGTPSIFSTLSPFFPLFFAL